MTKTDEFLKNEAARLRKEADRDERRALRNGDDPATYPTIRLNRIYADRMEAELCNGAA